MDPDDQGSNCLLPRKNESEMHLKICSRREKQTFSGPKNSGGLRVNIKTLSLICLYNVKILSSAVAVICSQWPIFLHIKKNN